MRLSENKIKEAIFDSDVEIRQRAISYFAKSHSTDQSVMPLVINAVETFGKEDAYHLIGLSRDLVQTDETIAWIINELNDGQSDQYENYTYNLSMVLVEADPALLLPKESEILESQHFLPDLRASFSERLQMLSWDEATCWQKLEDFCEENKDKQYINEVNVGYGRRIVEALARFGDECEEKVHAILSQSVEEHRDAAMGWMEPLVARLAGEMQLESTLSLIIAKLISDRGDLLNEECSEALTRIGTPAVVEAVAEAYPDAPRHFRIYATEPLEKIHSDLAVETCLHLLRQEKDEGIQIILANALLSQFAHEGIEEARNLLVGRELDFESRGLRNYLLETCTLMGERFPEYDGWVAAEKSEKEEHWRRVKELEGDPAGLIRFALEKLVGKKLADPPKTKLAFPVATRQSIAPQFESKRKVGRNERCPCGSGKKFKQCCLQKEDR
ncbi:MAG: SEC-C metal-binding domain-containing protein [Planctomycetaceae bacterium]